MREELHLYIYKHTILLRPSLALLIAYFKERKGKERKKPPSRLSHCYVYIFYHTCKIMIEFDTWVQRG